MLSLFDLMAEEDQDDRELDTLHTVQKLSKMTFNHI